MKIHVSRRTFCSTLPILCTGALQACSSLDIQNKNISVGALFAGKVDDKGFMQAGYHGLSRARTELGVKTQYIDGVNPSKKLLIEALEKLARTGVDLVIAHGGQNNEACSEIAPLFPNVKFVVTQGSVTGINLASYEVLQEESAYLAGVLAALTTQTGVVGHMSGIRVKPGLKGRAAFAAGVKATDSNIKLLTNFSGNQDDNALSKKVANALIDAHADIIFTMLNSGRQGVIDACRDRRVRQIGNVSDWVQLNSQVFIGSAIADVSIAVYEAIKQTNEGRFVASVINKVGLINRDAVRLSIADDVPKHIKKKIIQISDALQKGEIKIADSYDGPEFSMSI
jgi:basic membrane protein A